MTSTKTGRTAIKMKLADGRKFVTYQNDKGRVVIVNRSKYNSGHWKKASGNVKGALGLTKADIKIKA